MESRFRKYFAIRRLGLLSSAGRNQSLDDLNLQSVPYESTSVGGKPPVFIHQPLRKGSAIRKPKDDLDELAIRAFSYDSTLAGKPPIMGGKPLKGNGPVKLQTSRRLSSGELLATSQDSERTLEDIREGEYIVGGKEKRLSRTGQARSPTPGVRTVTSPRELCTLNTSSLPHLPLSTRRSHNSVKATFDTTPQAGDRSTSNSPRVSSVSSHASKRGNINTANESPISAASSLALGASTRSVEHISLLPHNEEQNSTIQALWKAEYGRLIAIYGKEGVDRNIAELDRDRRQSSSPVKELTTVEGMTALAMTLEPLPKPSLDSNLEQPRRHSRLSSTKETSSTEDSSDYASTIRSSVTSADGFSASHTVRSSGFEPDLPTTREDVRKVIEDMRSTYLRAIEASGRDSLQAKKTKRRKQRASYSAVGHMSNHSTSSTKRPQRQSWHPSNGHAPAPVIRLDRREEQRQPINGGKMSPVKSLQRADSMTLGSLMPSTPNQSSKKKSPKTSQTSRSPQTPVAVLDSPADLMLHHQPTYYNEFDVLEPEIAPEIEDFDIFYQDLYGPPPSAASLSSLPRRKYAEAAAPPPPDIEWTPKKRYVNQI